MVASFGGSLAWVVYETLNTLTGADLLSLFAASIAIGIYSEIMARKMKSPATIFYIPGFITLVPGAYVYYTMLEAAEQNYGGALDMFLITLLKSAAISLGLIIASAIVAVTLSIKRIRQNTRRKELKNN